MSTYNKSGSLLFFINTKRKMKKISDELNEHRYYLERNVALRTEQLSKRIELLEYCNATLCEKLALSQRNLDSPESLLQIPEHSSSSVKLYIVNSDDQREVA